MQEKVFEALNKLSWQYTIIFCLLIVAYFYFTLDMSQLEGKRQTFMTAKSTMNALEAKLRETEQFERDLDNRKKNYLSLVKKFQQTQSRLPTKLNMPTILGEVLEQAGNVGLELNNINPEQKERDHQIYNSQGISLEARGTYIQFIIFFDRLSRNERVYGVNSLFLERDGDGQRIPLSGILDTGSGRAKVAGERQLYALKGNFRLLAYRMDPEKVKQDAQQ